MQIFIDSADLAQIRECGYPSKIIVGSINVLRTAQPQPQPARSRSQGQHDGRAAGRVPEARPVHGAPELQPELDCQTDRQAEVAIEACIENSRHPGAGSASGHLYLAPPRAGSVKVTPYSVRSYRWTTAAGWPTRATKLTRSGYCSCAFWDASVNVPPKK